ncbi:hypothetical protein OUZ56_032496 [Daphnia magna]|uniref:Uncharacterized protein n=1 Tax=Daphnia magna TaxID=35525 RepID=A0ABR0B929_9CRUS|nr:hypothetical protein OUZ56_032496 [Daphnia magna]
MGYEILALAFATAVFVAVVIGFAVIYRIDATDRDALEVRWEAWAKSAGYTYVPAEGGWPTKSSPQVLLAPKQTLLGKLLLATEPFADQTFLRKTGDSGFDATFHLIANPTSVQERVLTTELRRRLQGFSLGRYLRFAFARGKISLTWEGAEENFSRIEEACAIARAVETALFVQAPPLAAVPPGTPKERPRLVL